MKICATCDGRVKNTANINSVKPFGRTVAGYIVPLNDSDGVRNFLDLNASDLDAELLGLVNHQDPMKRWYPIRNLKNVAPEQAEDTFATDDTNQRFKTLNGIKTFNAEVWGVTNTFFAQIEDQCIPFGFVPVDDCGNLKGEVNSDYTEFYPRLVNDQSYSARYMDTTASDPAKATFSFDYDLLSTDGTQEMLGFSSFTDINPAQLEGMLDVNIDVVSNASSSTIEIDMYYNFGAILNKKKFTGADETLFDINNVTQGTPIAIDTFTDNGNGSYTIVYVTGDAPATTDVVSIDYFDPATGVLVNGFEGIQETYESA